MAMQQAQTRNLTVATELSAVSTNFRLNDITTIISTRQDYLCESTQSSTTESITLNNGLFLNPRAIGITRTELTTTDIDLTIPTAIIDEFDFIFVEANTASNALTVTIPSHNTDTQKVITIARVGAAGDVTVAGLTSNDVVLSQENDSVECRQTATGGSSWAPTLSYSLMDRVPHEWTEFNEFTSGEQHSTNVDGIQNTRVYGLEETSANITFGTVASDGTAKTTRATIGYTDTPMEQALEIKSAVDVEIGSLIDGQETRVENFTFPKVTTPDTITMPTDSGNNGDVMRVNGSGVLSMDDTLTQEETLVILVDDNYTLEKAVADNRWNLLIRATPQTDGNNYTITLGDGIIGYSRIRILYDGSTTNGVVTVTGAGYFHGVTEFYLLKHGDYLDIQKSNSLTGNFYTPVGGQFEHNGTADELGLYSSNMYDRIRNQSVEESITEALATVTTNKITKSVSDIGYANGVDFSTTEAQIVFSSALGVDVTVVEGTRSVWKSGTNSGFAIFCGGTISDPTNTNFDGGEIVIAKEQLPSIGEILFLRASSSGSDPRGMSAYLGPAPSGGLEITPFFGDGDQASQANANVVGFNVTGNNNTLPEEDLHIYFSKQYVKDANLTGNDFLERVVVLEDSKNEIVNSDRTALVTVSDAGAMLAASTDPTTREISTLTISESKMVFANATSVTETDTSLSSNITYSGSSRLLVLNDYATTDLTPTSPVDPDLGVSITGVDASFTGDFGGAPELLGFAWNQSGQVASNYTEYTISNVTRGARVRAYFTAFSYGSDTEIRVDPFSGFDTTTIETVNTDGTATPSEYNSVEYTTNDTTCVIRVRGGNVTPYQAVRFDITQDFPLPPSAEDSEVFGLQSDDKGFGLPTLDPANVTSPVNGLLIRDNTDNGKVKQWDGELGEWRGFDDRVRQRFTLTSASPNPKWYRLVTCQPTAHFKRDCTITTEDGSHSQSCDFSFGVRGRLNDGRNDQDSRSALTTMHMRNNTAFQYQNGSTTDTPLRAMRMVQEGNSDANRVIHIDILAWQDSSNATINALWQGSKYPEEDNGVILDNVTEAPALGVNDTVEEYNLQGFVERNKDNYAVEYERSTGISSFVQPTSYNYQVSCSAGGGKRFETGSYVLTNPGPSVTRNSAGAYTIDFPANTFPTDFVDVILHVSSNEGSSSSTNTSANAFMLDREKIRVAMSNGTTLTDTNFAVSVTWVRQ